MGRKDSTNIFNISSQPNVNNLFCVCFFMINIYLFTALQFASQSSFQRLHGQEKPSQTSEFTFKSLSAENVLSLLETAHYCYLLQQRNEILMWNNPGMDSSLLTLWKSKWIAADPGSPWAVGLLLGVNSALKACSVIRKKTFLCDSSLYISDYMEGRSITEDRMKDGYCSEEETNHWELKWV